MGFFKAYDMRGTFGVDFDLDVVYQVGLALPRVVGGTRWLVGRDCRTSSPSVHDALVKGLCEAGAEVVDLGLCTTPMVYFFTAQDGFDGSVMITASHNPPSDNGLKVSKRGALPVGYADGLDQVEKLVAASTAKYVPDGKPRGTLLAGARERYLEWQMARMPKLDGLRFAVDCSNGMASLLAPALFPGAVLLNGELDGSFPAHSPNPLKDEAREMLARTVREQGLDCGVIFDGDADRAMFVDEKGEFVQPDYLIPAVAHATREAGGGNVRGRLVIHDVRTSRGALEALRRDGFEPVMVPVGHAFAKPKLRELQALCGGELAGHYYFSEFFNCDSGVLAATRVLGEIAVAKARGETFSQLMAPVTTRYANSGEVNFRVEDKPAAIARVLQCVPNLGQETGRSDIDGYRIEFSEGWVSVRQSNTEPFLRLLAECESSEHLAEWMKVLKKAILGE